LSGPLFNSAELAGDQTFVDGFKTDRLLEEICPEHNAQEECRLLDHFHTDEFCFKVFNMNCGHLFSVKSQRPHCSQKVAGKQK